MKILHINSYYQHSHFYKNLYEIQSNESDVQVYVPVSNQSDENFDYGTYTCISACFNKFDRSIFHLKHLKIYKDILKKYDFSKFDIIHAHSLFSNGYIAYKLNKKYHIPYIVAVRNTDINVFFKKMVHLRHLGIDILKNASKIIFISESYKTQCLDKYVPKKYRKELLNKSVVIPNGLDNFYFLHKNNPKSLTDIKNINLLYVGDINKNKNILFTCSAIEKMLQTGYQININVIGKVLDKKIYDTLIEKEYVTYYSPLDKQKLITFFKQSDIFVMPSITETFGLVYLESMSQGTPVIYTDGQGFSSFFNEGVVGYSVNLENVDSMVNAIKKTILNYDKISRNCTEFLTEFSWKKISEKYNDIYKTR